MEPLSPEQRNNCFLMEAIRTGLHKPILAALHMVQDQPALVGGETGLGIVPVHRLPVEQVSQWSQQVQYAANTIRSLIDNLIAKGWKAGDLWNYEQDRYTDKLIHKIAEGYVPPANDKVAAQLEFSDAEALLQAYLEDSISYDQTDPQAKNLGDLDEKLLAFAETIPQIYTGHPAQKDAVLDAARIWWKLDSREAATNVFSEATSLGEVQGEESRWRSSIQPPLEPFLKEIIQHYSGYPHQREAILRLVQLWWQLDSREMAIDVLQSNTPQITHLEMLDPALMAFVQRLPHCYHHRGEQRFALTEAFRLWQQLDSRPAVLRALGVDPQALAANSADQVALTNAATQLDRGLLNFIRHIPIAYEETESQREALIRLVQLWRRIDSRRVTLQSLFEDIQSMQTAHRDSLDAPPTPTPLLISPRPNHWNPDNIQMHMAIMPNGSFSWSEATRGGAYLPPNPDTIDAIARIAELAQRARDRIGRPFRITHWYQPTVADIPGEPSSQNRHVLGDAIIVYCDGLTGAQIYWTLDPWWPGGLGRYRQFPYLISLDARPDRVRWHR